MLWPSGGSVFFSALTPGLGREPWVSDGTEATTRLVNDMVPGPSGESWLRHVVATSRGTLLTFGNLPAPGTGSYWLTTATGAAAADVTFLWSSPLISTGAVGLGGGALLLASDFQTSAQLWNTDLTVGAPDVLYDKLIGAFGFTPARDQVFFLDGQNPLMVTDGTTAGTHKVRAWPDGIQGSALVRGMRSLDHRVVFNVASPKRIGDELWISDGTRNGTTLLRDIRRGPASSRPRSLTRWADRIYFTANDGRHGRQIWRTDGTKAGTWRVTDLDVNTGAPVVCDGALFFIGVDQAGAALWTSQGTRGSERRVAKLPGARGSRPKSPRCLPGGLAFTAHDPQHGRELWTLPNGRHRPTLHDIRPGRRSSVPHSLTRAGNSLFFIANDGKQAANSGPPACNHRHTPSPQQQPEPTRCDSVRRALRGHTGHEPRSERPVAQGIGYRVRRRRGILKSWRRCLRLWVAPRACSVWPERGMSGSWRTRWSATRSATAFIPSGSRRIGEALGGPKEFSARYGDETSVVRMHSGNGPHDEMDRRAVACFDQALADVGIGEGDRLRQVRHDYSAWATTTTMARYHRSAEDVPDGLAIPQWSWAGLVDAP